MSSRLWLVLALVTVFGGALLWSATPARAGDGETGTVRVVNDTDFTLEIRMDGNRKTSLSPGTKQTLRGIPPGSHQFQAVTPQGSVKFEKTLRLQAGQTLSWILKWTRTEGPLAMDDPQPTHGAIAVRNEVHGSLQLVVDGIERGWLLEGERRTIQSCDEGNHQVVLLDRAGRTVRDEQVSVQRLETILLVVAPPVGEPRTTASSRGRPVWVRTRDGWDLHFE